MKLAGSSVSVTPTMPAALSRSSRIRCTASFTPCGDVAKYSSIASAVDTSMSLLVKAAVRLGTSLQSPVVAPPYSSR
jgi:hypothetical protein